MALNVSKTKYKILHTRNKNIVLTNLTLVYNICTVPNEPYDATFASTLEPYYNSHADTNCRSYELLGIQLNKHLSFNHLYLPCNKLPISTVSAVKTETSKKIAKKKG
jgi:hypothetical protein